MSHGDRIETLPPDFITLGSSQNSPIAALGDLSRNYYGLQFHPEVRHTPGGKAILSNFVFRICQARKDWTPDSIISERVQRIREQVGNETVISAVSGGVDSSVATGLVQQAVGDQLIAVFVDNGLLRQGEVDQVQSALHEQLGAELIIVDAVDHFMSALDGIEDPECGGHRESRHGSEQDGCFRVVEVCAREIACCCWGVDSEFSLSGSVVEWEVIVLLLYTVK